MKLDTEIIYLLGNKVDLIEDREVSDNQGKRVFIAIFISYQLTTLTVTIFKSSPTEII